MRSRLRNDYDYCRNQASLYIQVVSLRSPQSLRNETFSFGTPVAVNRSITLLSIPQVIGLMKPPGGGEYAVLIFKI